MTRDKLREAIAIMDEKGRGWPGGEGRGMSNDNWDTVRRLIWEAFEMTRKEGSHVFPN